MINIIIPFFRNLDTIEHLLKSIQDQDYKEFDVTIVMDGKDEESETALQGHLKKFTSTIYLESIPNNSGASVARNYGAKISGENLMCDNKDSILFFIG
jgi:glycosyltransferase involved in cell wall biosynthesis